ncbi:MAG TPA: hypothetical protein VFZ66_22615 [Herpetosiphonaceae bacterium]
MSYRYERYRERPRSRVRGWLVALTILVWLLVLGFVALRFFVRPGVTNYVNRQIAESINPQAAPDDSTRDALRDSLQQVPIDISVPAGEIRVTEAQANGYLAAYRERLSGIDDLQLRFVPGEVQADITVSGVTSTAHARPEVRDGQIIATEQRLDPPLGLILSMDDLLGAFQDRINAEFAAQGRTVKGIRIEQGEAVITLE